MPYVIAVAALIGVLCMMDLVLTLGVVRRLKEHDKLIEVLYETLEAGGLAGSSGLAVGDRVGDFDVTAVDGARTTLGSLPDGAVVAFVAAECDACRKELPELVKWASGQDRSRVLVVVDGHGGDPRPMVRALSPVAQVVLEDGGGAASQAFGIRSFPSFFQVGGGVVQGRVRGVSRLPAGSTA
ncbi:redoxin domain-containing protein [Nonomuraea spiralis]|uniref:TlpA family protein disulfide reductase n=1 Tax=Nonomuraea TaxID=83681 RepID=UPI00163D1208|nr:redoxin domain-containing protein [Nonomuraea sp. WAC 01424]